jgi:hypothetical protein
MSSPELGEEVPAPLGFVEYIEVAVRVTILRAAPGGPSKR